MVSQGNRRKSLLSMVTFNVVCSKYFIIKKHTRDIIYLHYAVQKKILNRSRNSSLFILLVPSSVANSSNIFQYNLFLHKSFKVVLVVYWIVTFARFQMKLHRFLQVRTSLSDYNDTSFSNKGMLLRTFNNVLGIYLLFEEISIFSDSLFSHDHYH